MKRLFLLRRKLLAAAASTLLLASCGTGESTEAVGSNEHAVPLWVTGSQFYVSPEGSPEGAGSRDSPWDLATALKQPEIVMPGDTIWMRGGTYRGVFVGDLIGTKEQPVTLRQYPGERASIDTGSVSGAALTIRGSDAVYWGFEIFSSDPKRVTDKNGAFGTLNRAVGVNVIGTRIKLVNLVIHDVAQGIALPEQAVEAEVYGNLIYHCGWRGPKRSYGPGLDARNSDAVDRIEENIQFAGFETGLRALGSKTAGASHYRFIGNVSFNSGVLQDDKLSKWPNFFVSSADGADDIVFQDNHSFNSSSHGTGRANLGWIYGEREKGARVSGNFWVGGQEALAVWNWEHFQFVNNTVVSENRIEVTLNLKEDQTVSAYEWNGNHYFGSGKFRFNGKNTVWKEWRRKTGLDQQSEYTPGVPTRNWVFIRPNRYEPGRAHIIVYNWEDSRKIGVDLSDLLPQGNSFTIRDAENYFGKPLVSGVYKGGSVEIPMKGLKPARPVGNVPHQPKHTAPEFGVFVVSPDFRLGSPRDAS